MDVISRRLLGFWRFQRHLRSFAQRLLKCGSCGSFHAVFWKDLMWMLWCSEHHRCDLQLVSESYKLETSVVTK